LLAGEGGGQITLATDDNPQIDQPSRDIKRVGFKPLADRQRPLVHRSSPGEVTARTKSVSKAPEGGRESGRVRRHALLHSQGAPEQAFRLAERAETSGDPPKPREALRNGEGARSAPFPQRQCALLAVPGQREVILEEDRPPKIAQPYGDAEKAGEVL